MTVIEKISARDLFRKAYENRYTWDSNFPGYSADITYKRNEEIFSGKVHITPDLKGEITGIEDTAAKKAIEGQVWEITIHRIRRGFEDTHGNNTFSYGETDADGSIEILMGGKAEGDRYKLHNNEVSMVHRNIHGTVVTINTFSSHDTGEGYLSHRYDSVYHDPKTGEQKGGVSNFEDEYEKVGGYSILNRRLISTEVKGETQTQEFLFSNLKLLA
ncbi:MULTISPECIES: DUF3386 domain-containing protein [Spirulina sp. CCY15215]|uniref:DUF3386 domain-containing protein n=1 Tax=Spirulina sp. CCY15215 TaxID=2767591 RepID=UPI0019529CEB|nr:DUF3386 domain-containing protein [Spirulina major]